MQSKPLTDAQVYTLRRMASGTNYLLSADERKGDEDRSTPRETRRVNAPSLPVLFRAGLVEFAVKYAVREKGRWYKVRLTEAGRKAALTATTKDERGELTRGTVRFPTCKVDLHWHQIHGMRLLEEHGGKMMYSARCPECSNSYKVAK